MPPKYTEISYGAVGSDDESEARHRDETEKRIFERLCQRLELKGNKWTLELRRLTDGQKSVISEALENAGRTWLTLEFVADNPEILQSLGHLIAFWGSPVGSKPKTQEQHESEAKVFAELVNRSVR